MDALALGDRPLTPHHPPSLLVLHDLQNHRSSFHRYHQFLPRPFGFSDVTSSCSSSLCLRCAEGTLRDGRDKHDPKGSDFARPDDGKANLPKRSRSPEEFKENPMTIQPTLRRRQK